MEQSGNVPIFNIPGILFRNIPWNLIGNFFPIFWECIMGMFHDYSTNNTPGILFGNIPPNFIGNFFRIFWEYIMGVFQEYSTNIYLASGDYAETRNCYVTETVLFDRCCNVPLVP